jgi:hypothetical protein
MMIHHSQLYDSNIPASPFPNVGPKAPPGLNPGLLNAPTRLCRSSAAVGRKAMEKPGVPVSVALGDLFA